MAQIQAESFSCSVCLELPKEPVTIPCGHSYCRTCISCFWDGERDNVYSCPQCRKKFSPRPVLMKNTMLAELVDQLKESGHQEAAGEPSSAAAEDVACDFCTGRKAFKSCLNCVASYCVEHLQPHSQTAALSRHWLVDPSKNLQENIKHKGHNTVSAAAERTERQKVKVLQPPEPTSRDGFLQYLQNITLDPNTAQGWLRLSEGNRKATRMRKVQGHPWHRDRFTMCPQVLSRESLTGRCYWEVEVEVRKGRVGVSVAYKSISRDGRGKKAGFGLNDKSWSLFCDEQTYYQHNDVHTEVSGPRSSRIGVFVDHTAATLSFYSVCDAMTLLCRVHAAFTEPLHAGLCIPSTDGFASAEFCEL